MYEPFRINYRPHSTVSVPCPSIYPPTVPRHVQIFLISPPHSSHQPALYLDTLSFPVRALRRHHRTRTRPSRSVSQAKRLSIFSPPNKKRAAFPQPGRRLIFTLHVRERASAFLPGRRRFKHHSAPGQETATLQDRGHTGPQSPAGRSGPQPGRDCKACAADPSFRFRRVFSFRR